MNYVQGKEKPVPTLHHKAPRNADTGTILNFRYDMVCISELDTNLLD